MSVPIIMSGYAPTLGAPITNVSTSLTVSTDSGDNGHVWMLIDTEIMDGDKSGTTVSNLVRASEKYNGTAAAASHSAGATVYFILGRGLSQASFVTKIDEAVLSGAAATVTFPYSISALPTTFKHLEMIWDARGDTAANGTAVAIQLNADVTAADYTINQMYGNNSAATVAYTTSSGDIGRMPANTGLAGRAGGGRVLFRNYNATVFNKDWLAQWHDFEAANAAGSYTGVRGGTWSSAAAITSIKVLTGAGNFIIGSTFSLYGIP